MMGGRSRNYTDGFYRSLRNDDEALEYLKAALEDSQAAFLVALRNFAEARNFAEVARESGIDRAHLYRTLSKSGNPTLSSLGKLLSALGLRLGVDLEASTVMAPTPAHKLSRTPWHISTTRRKRSAVYAQPPKVLCIYGSPMVHRTGGSAKRPPGSSLTVKDEGLCEMAY